MKKYNDFYNNTILSTSDIYDKILSKNNNLINKTEELSNYFTDINISLDKITQKNKKIAYQSF